MQNKKVLKLTLASVLTLGIGSAQAVPALFDFGINIDGVTSCNAGPCGTDGLTDLSGVLGVDDSSFDFLTGLGSIEVTVGGAGPHSVDLFLDHEIDQLTNTFFNEFGGVGNLGSLAAGQSWEIDEPGFVFGDIFNNFVASALDNSNAVLAAAPDDVSMAMGFDFSLGAGGTTTLSFLVGDVMPTGFFMSHTDPDSNETIYFSASIVSVPEPTSLLLLCIGLAGAVVARRQGAQRS